MISKSEIHMKIVVYVNSIKYGFSHEFHMYFFTGWWIYLKFTWKIPCVLVHMKQASHKLYMLWICQCLLLKSDFCVLLSKLKTCLIIIEVLKSWNKFCIRVRWNEIGSICNASLQYLFAVYAIWFANELVN